MNDRRSAHRYRRSTNVPNIAATCLLCVLAVISLAILAGPLLGYRVLLIRSGSMTPTFRVGDLVIDTPVHPMQVRPGDVVTFLDPNLGGQLVTHRVVSVRRSGNEVDFVTKGDANRVNEHWSVPVTHSIGRAVLSDPDLGSLLTLVSAPLARVIEVLLGVLWVGYLGLRRIWGEPSRSIAGVRRQRALQGAPASFP